MRFCEVSKTIYDMLNLIYFKYFVCCINYILFIELISITYFLLLK